ncbi:MAG: coniferyl-aldehyde dehydrogenase, partial [Burkholderiaceae bacterium]
MMNPLIERMHTTLATQRAAFLKHPYPTHAERRTKLKALKKVLQRYQDAIVTAVDADFGGRSASETKLVEVMGPILEANHALSSLRSWMQPRDRHTELLF